MPPLGFRRYPLVAAAVPAGPAGLAADGWTDAGGLAIENDAFLVTGADGHGALASVFDKAAGRELLTRPGNDLVLQEEYQQHPRWNEGPWHLSPKGPGLASCAVAAGVRAQRSPAGSRLVATYALGDLSVTAETVLWDGSDRVEFRTHVSGSIGKEHLLRVRFPAALPGGLPVYQTATAVIGRPFGAPEADVAEHWWTLDNPANHWFGIGSVARAAVAADGGDVCVALGVAEVVTPDQVPGRAAARRQGPAHLAGPGRRHGHLLALVRHPVRLGRRGLQPARLPDHPSAGRRRTRSPRRCSRRATRRWPSGSPGWSATPARRGCGCPRPGTARPRSRRARTCAGPVTCRCSSWPPPSPGRSPRRSASWSAT